MDCLSFDASFELSSVIIDVVFVELRTGEGSAFIAFPWIQAFYTYFMQLVAILSSFHYLIYLSPGYKAFI